jgi:hypothetical protein
MTDQVPEVPGIPHAAEPSARRYLAGPGQVAGVLGEFLQGLPYNVINAANAVAAQLTRLMPEKDQDREAG